MNAQLQLVSIAEDLSSDTGEKAFCLILETLGYKILVFETIV